MARYKVLAEGGLWHGPGGTIVAKKGSILDDSDLSKEAVKWLLADKLIAPDGKAKAATKPSDEKEGDE